ncbi:MAG: protein kinase [Deltaproteobacteria bacterium]|nr:protein kinase [Deltaproteobacteria bacterium]
MAQPGDKRGKYVIVRRLGEGGMGSVYEAVYLDESSGFEQRVAIKEADPDIIATEEGRDLFYREAMLPSSLRHPNIATVLEVSANEGYLVYELVDGASMADVLRATGNRLTTQLTVFLLSQICRALAYAHNRVLHGKLSPVVHRDLSPQNIMIDYDGNIKIVDWGIAKATNSREKSKTIKGKLSYMSPEQASGGEIDERTDIYALGVIAYEMVTGIRPNDGDRDVETLHILLTGSHVPVTELAPEIPAGLGKTIEKMLALSPEDRFAKMEDVLDALTPFSPPYTVYRELAALVRKAHPPETIVIEQGRFVSRRIEERTQASKPITAAPSSVNNTTGSLLRIKATETFEYQKRGSNQGATSEPSSADGGFYGRQSTIGPFSSSVEPELLFRRGRMINLGILVVGAIAALALLTFIFLKFSQGPLVAETQSVSGTSINVPKPMKLPEKQAEPGGNTQEYSGGQTVSNASVPSVSVTQQPVLPSDSQTPKSAQNPQPDPRTQAHPTESASLARSGQASKSGARSRKSPSNSSRSKADETPLISPVSVSETKRIYVGVSPSNKAYTVWVDGEKKGNTPLAIDLAKGTHSIAVGLKEPGYAKRIRISDQMNERVIFNLDEELFNLDNF